MNHQSKQTDHLLIQLPELIIINHNSIMLTRHSRFGSVHIRYNKLLLFNESESRCRSDKLEATVAI